MSRFNALNAERERKRKAGESLPPLVSEQVRQHGHDASLCCLAAPLAAAEAD